MPDRIVLGVLDTVAGTAFGAGLDRSKIHLMLVAVVTWWRESVPAQHETGVFADCAVAAGAPLLHPM